MQHKAVRLRGQIDAEERRPRDARAEAAAAHGGDVRERRLAKFRQNVARFRLYRLRFLQENMRFAAFFKIYQILKLKFLKFGKILQTSPFRDRVAELRGPSEGLGGGCALLGCTAASRASVEQPIGTSRSSRSKGELVQFEMIQSD